MRPRGAEKFRNSLIIFKMKSSLMLYTLFFILLFYVLRVCVQKCCLLPHFAFTFYHILRIIRHPLRLLSTGRMRNVTVCMPPSSHLTFPLRSAAVRELAKTGEHDFSEHEKQIKQIAKKI